MKRIFNIATGILFVCLLTFNGYSQDLKVMTYNIRYDSPNDGENVWTLRKDFLVSQIAFYEPDIFGIQEGMDHQVKYLDAELKAYQYLGVGRDDGKEKGEYSAIYFKKDKYKVLQQSTFWLSKTPDKPSKNWDAALPRICTYALFKDKDTDVLFWVFNTHFDHKGAQSRAESVKVILAKIKEANVNSHPVILMGDFNMQPQDPTVKSLTKTMGDTYVLSEEKPFGPIGTFSGFDVTAPLERRIDYIFISDSERMKVQKYAVLSDIKDSKFPSDHLPVFVQLEIK